MRHLSTILALILLTLSACADLEAPAQRAEEPVAAEPVPSSEPVPTAAPSVAPTAPSVVAPTATTAPTTAPVPTVAPTAPEAPTPAPNPVFVENQQECKLLNSDDASITSLTIWNCMSMVDTLAKYEPNTKIVAFSYYDIYTVMINILPDVPENYKTTFKNSLQYQSKFKSTYLVCTQDFINNTNPASNPNYGYEQVLQAKAKQYLCQQAYKWVK